MWPESFYSPRLIGARAHCAGVKSETRHLVSDIFYDRPFVESRLIFVRPNGEVSSKPNALDAAYAVKMWIIGQHSHAVLPSEGRNPRVIGRNGRRCILE